MPRRTYPIPNLEDALPTLTPEEMVRLGWPRVLETVDIDTGVVLEPEHVRVPETTRCQRCRSVWPRDRWKDHIRDVRAIARFPEDFICSGCMRGEMIYRGYLRSQFLRDINAPQAAITAMRARPPIQRGAGR